MPTLMTSRIPKMADSQGLMKLRLILEIKNSGIPLRISVPFFLFLASTVSTFLDAFAFLGYFPRISLASTLCSYRVIRNDGPPVPVEIL